MMYFARVQLRDASVSNRMLSACVSRKEGLRIGCFAGPDGQMIGPVVDVTTSTANSTGALTGDVDSVQAVQTGVWMVMMAVPLRVASESRPVLQGEYNLGESTEGRIFALFY